MSGSRRGLYGGWSPDAQNTTSSDAHHERRGAQRVVLDADASFVGEASDEPVPARVINLSTTGAFLVANRLYGVGNILKLTITLSDTREITGTAIVRTRLRARGNGVEFLMLVSDARRTIESLTERPVGGFKATVYENW